jgi:DNA mismatch endonuclease (patch repair protein)
MNDTLTRSQRSERMSRVKGKDTKPELRVRRVLHGMGYRYRLQRRDLPGSPDIVFGSRGKVVFVHGCFWHRHEGCPLARMPKSRQDFWGPKLRRNVERDQKNQEELTRNGWAWLVVWECETKDTQTLKDKLVSFLDGTKMQDKC